MRRILLILGTFGVGVALFFVLLAGVGWQEVWASIKTFSIGEAAIAIVLTALFLFLGVVRWKKILKSQGQNIPLWDLWKMYVAGFSLLFFIPIVPFANELLRSTVLKEQHGVAFKKGVASVVIDRILEITSTLCVVVVGSAIFLFIGHSFSHSLKTMAVAGFIVLWIVFLTWLYIRLFQNKSVLRLFWRGNGASKEIEQEICTFFSFTNIYFWQGLALSFARSFAGLLRVWAFILFLGKGVAFLPGVTILGFYYLGTLVPIPVALGLHDALQAVGFSAFGMGAGTGAAFAFLTRAIEVLFALGGLLFLFHFGFLAMGSFSLEKKRAYKNAAA
jgi:uncharacterized protein (TIRG00374 family)